MQCPESLRVQAYLDNEVDSLAAADIEHHLAHCAACQAQRAELEALRAAIRAEVPALSTPPDLRQRVEQALDAERLLERAPPARARQPWWRTSFWIGVASGLGAAVAAALVVVAIVVPLRTNPLVSELVGAHLSSLMSTHLVDVLSTDKHTVKPWFAGHADVSPAVADFSSQGYRLKGGRVDYLEHERAAVVVYEHGAHVINVFCWPAPLGPLPARATRKGYHVALWKSGDLAYAAVSDAGWEEIAALEGLLRGLAAGDPPM